MNEATGPSDVGWNSVANPPTGQGEERVREEGEVEEAQAPSETLHQGEGETLLKQMRRKREAKPPH